MTPTNNWSRNVKQFVLIGKSNFDVLQKLTVKEMGGITQSKGTEKLAIDGASIGHYLEIKTHTVLYFVRAKGSAWITPPPDQDIQEGDTITRSRPKLHPPNISRAELSQSRQHLLSLIQS